jgi:hypothetical protein
MACSTTNRVVEQVHLFVRPVSGGKSLLRRQKMEKNRNTNATRFGRLFATVFAMTNCFRRQEMKENVNTNSKKFNRLFATVFAAIFALGIGFIGCDMTDDLSGLVNNDGSDQKTGGGLLRRPQRRGRAPTPMRRMLRLKRLQRARIFIIRLTGQTPPQRARSTPVLLLLASRKHSKPLLLKRT